MAEGGEAAVKTVANPWGQEVWWAVTDRYVGKVIDVKAGQSLSLQYHERKLESMYFVAGRGRLTLGERVIEIQPGLAVTIHPREVHRVEATEDIRFFEVSTPEVEDVVRIEDRYGRAGDGRG